MGEARVRELNGTPSIGDSWKWAQRDFEERPVKFKLDANKNPIRHKYIHPVLKKLNRLMARTERKHEAANPKAVLTIASLESRFEALSAKRDKLIKRLNPLA
jgi:hypothetical protein